MVFRGTKQEQLRLMGMMLDMPQFAGNFRLVHWGAPPRNSWFLIILIHFYSFQQYPKGFPDSETCSKHGWYCKAQRHPSENTTFVSICWVNSFELYVWLSPKLAAGIQTVPSMTHPTIGHQDSFQKVSKNPWVSLFTHDGLFISTTVF